MKNVICDCCGKCHEHIEDRNPKGAVEIKIVLQHTIDDKGLFEIYESEDIDICPDCASNMTPEELTEACYEILKADANMGLEGT